MSDDLFFSSDTFRSGIPLRHAESVTFDEPLPLELGGELEGVRVVYETYGRLNEARDNGVLICHALTGDSHVAAHDAQDDPGWWEIAIGPGKAIDTDRYFVICPNILGGCRGTTGPNQASPATGRPYGPDFPPVTIADMVELQRRLADHLGVETLAGVIGGSMGGMQVLQWAISHPDRLRAAIPIAAAPRLTSQGLAFDVIGRNAIMQDPRFREGRCYADRPSPDGTFAPAAPIPGLAIARMIGHITYLSREAMRDKFGGTRNQPMDVASTFEKDTSVASYLAYQGDKFVERFDANSYVVISRAMDGFDLGEGEQLVRSLAPVRCRWMVISFGSDWLFPADQSREIVRALVASDRCVSYCEVASLCGHDAFLLETELRLYGGLMAGFLAHATNGEPPEAEVEADAEGHVEHPNTSIFHGRRLDYDLVEKLLAEEIPGDSPSVLDLGCGDGQLLLRLKGRGNGAGTEAGRRWLQGVELDQESVLACVRRGVDCIQADLNDGLDQFADKQFDCVIVSQTLQTIYNVDRVVEDILRVGRRCIVSFPNFAYEPLRKMLDQQGRAPVAPGLLRNQWYDTDNIRFISIADFEDYCRRRSATIHRLVALDTESRKVVEDDPNRNADLAIFVISRQ